MVDLETTEVITNVGYCMVEVFLAFSTTGPRYES